MSEEEPATSTPDPDGRSGSDGDGRSGSDGDGRSRSDGGDHSRSDGGSLAGVDEARLRAIVREEVHDAVLGAVGTLLLVGIAFVLVVAGLQATLRGLADGSTVATAAGVALAAAGTAMAATTLGLLPPVRTWLSP